MQREKQRISKHAAENIDEIESSLEIYKETNKSYNIKRENQIQLAE